MANFALNYSFSRNLAIPLDEDAVKQSYALVLDYVQTKSKCYAGQLFSVVNPEDETENGLYVAIKTGADALVVKLASQEALEAVAASAGKIDKITLNGTELTINDKVVNIDLSDYATVEYVDGKISDLASVYAPKAEFEEVQKKVDDITSVGGEPNVQSDWNIVDEESDAFIKNKPDLGIYATKTELNTSEETTKGYIDDAIEALGEVYAPKAVVETLVGEDANKSARAIAAEEVAKVVASADTDFDTLKEIADWIANDTTGSAQMSNDIAGLKAISADTRLEALEADTHVHENKGVLDGISAEKVAAWDVAEQNAKEHAESVANTAKENAIAESKSWVEEQNYLTQHQNISHLASKTELGEGVQEAKDYADGLAVNYDVAGAAASALTEAKAYTDVEIGKLGNVYDVKGAAEAAEGRANTYTDNKIAGLSEVYDVKGAAEAAEGRAKNYADGLAVNYDKKGDAEAALNSAKAYADGLAENYDAAGAAESALTEAKAYADGLAVNYDAAGAAESALTEAKAYADGLAVNYDAAGAAVAAAASALTEAKAYTDVEIGKLGNVYAPKAEFEEVQKKVDDITSVGGEPNVQSDWNIVDEESDAFIKNKPDLGIYATKEELEGAVSAGEEYADNAVSALQNSLVEVYAPKAVVETLIGKDADMSARAIAAEEVAKIVASADTKYDTLKEIADWIANDETNAANMANDIASLKAISADTRLEALEADTHVHENKELLDTYTQTEANLADAVAKKHEHENKEVLDGISAEKVAAWDAAEQNAKDYADELVENIKPYVDGIAVDVKEDNSINVKVSESEKNFLEVNASNELEVSKITLDAAETSKDIVVEGGQWAEAVKTVYGSTVPAGTTWESFLEAMLCVEKFAGTISTSSAFTVSCGDVNPGISGATNNTMVEIGTKVTLKKTTANDTTASQSLTAKTFTYGYKLGEDGSLVNSTAYTETLTPILKSSSKALKITFSNFADAVNNGSVIETKTADNEIEAVDMYVMSGTNKVTVSQTGDTYTSSSAVTAGTMYVATNLKNYYKSDKVTPNTYTPTAPSVDKTANDSTEYVLTGACKYFIGDITEHSDEYWNTDRSAVVRGLKTSGWATASTISDIEHTFKEGTKQQTVAVPANYTSVSGKDVNNGDVTFNLVKTFDFTNSKGYISSYNVFVAPALDGLGADSKIKITVK